MGVIRGYPGLLRGLDGRLLLRLEAGRPGLVPGRPPRARCAARAHSAGRPGCRDRDGRTGVREPTMSAQPFLDRLRERFGDTITGANLEAIDPWIEVAPDGLVDLCTWLRDQPDLRFDLLNCITAVD